MVGGGIAGLAAAHALRDAPVDVLVLESSPRLGGKLEVGEVAGLAVDTGAESVLARRPEAVDLARDVGLGDDLVEPVTTTARVLSRGALRPLPRPQVMGVPADLEDLARTGVLGPADLARVPLDAWLPRTRVEEDVSVGAYVARRVGRAVVDRLVEPLLGGVYAGRADALSMAATVPGLFAAVRAERSLLAAARGVAARTPAGAGPVFAGVRGGVGRLPAAVARASGAQVRTGAAVRGLRRTPGGWELVVGPASAPEVVRADAVVLAVPAPAAARLLAPLVPAAAAEVGHVPYASVALVTAAFPAAVLGEGSGGGPGGGSGGGSGGGLVGSGLLVPPVERRLVKAATFSSRKWGWVGEGSGTVVLRTSVGRAGDERDLQRDDAELAAAALADLAEVTGAPGLRTRPLDVVVTRWGGGLPQYAVGHLARVRRVRAALEPHPGLALAGAAYDGVGVPACVASGRAAAARVVAALRPGG
ncbi:protoporphyrinogen oxidase [Vallicoccus soli]|uniref:Coproporphyrinogen III oxidase n=1 Tax=Vallicoccus soli TaxID=2339232 RepID=A0A3A3YY69_9ACTN|nr:protoporphyrinogen oxidase [Vallicoccus soli]